MSVFHGDLLWRSGVSGGVLFRKCFMPVAPAPRTPRGLCHVNAATGSCLGLSLPSVFTGLVC